MAGIPRGPVPSIPAEKGAQSVSAKANAFSKHFYSRGISPIISLGGAP